MEMENPEELKDKFLVSLSLTQDDPESQYSSITDISLEKAIQLLHEKQKENNDLRGKCYYCIY